MREDDNCCENDNGSSKPNPGRRSHWKLYFAVIAVWTAIWPIVAEAVDPGAAFYLWILGVALILVDLGAMEGSLFRSLISGFRGDERSNGPDRSD